MSASIPMLRFRWVQNRSLPGGAGRPQLHAGQVALATTYALVASARREYLVAVAAMFARLSPPG